LALLQEDAPQRDYSLREDFNGVRWIACMGAQWRMMPNDLSPWYTVYQQAQRWIAAGVFEDMVHDLRVLLRAAKGKKEQPSAAIFNGWTMQSTPKVANEQVMMAIRGKKAAKSILPSILLDCSWLRTLHLPMSRNEPKSRS
jgi:transposase